MDTGNGRAAARWQVTGMRAWQRDAGDRHGTWQRGIERRARRVAARWQATDTARVPEHAGEQRSIGWPPATTGQLPAAAGDRSAAYRCE